EAAETRALAAAARTRLQLLGLSPADFAHAGAGPLRIVLRAPADGIAAEIAVREGETVAPGQLLFRLESATTIWLEARVPPVQAAALASGADVSAEIAGEASARAARIDAVLPDVDPATRTRRVRIVLANADGRLAAGQFAEVRLQGGAAEDHVWLASEALIADGREARVILRDGAGRFRPQRVQTGRVVDARTEILAGLSGGEEVVVSGQFLIDSEASLAGLLTRLDTEAEAAAPPPHRHDGHDRREGHDPHGEQR
ncbi:efflux RND transporter periplasmic adaptor subunit, partial [Tahibacter caeni]|uniref:efflux RND transporter periplasmic adaptor subunit n=1 Tax=Tahibacter caeni TaxID=1453545 RepID=UPI002148A5B7